MKKIKIKWGNVIKAIIFLFCVGLMLHDFYMVSISCFFTGQEVCLTWYGLATLLLAMAVSCEIWDDFEYQIEKMSTTRNS